MAGSFLTSVAVNLASKLGESLFAPTGRQFGYVLCYKSYIQDLKNEAKELESARERVQHSIDEARYNGKPIHTDVQDWLKSVKKEVEEAKNLLERGESRKSACFRGWIPNPMVRHPTGRKMKKTTEVIRKLHVKSRNSNFKEVYYENTPPGIVTATTSAARNHDNKEDVLESRALFAEEVIKAIADDKVSVVGVYGTGGVGKSKLLADIERRAKKENLFDVVASANVSRNPDIKRIQGEIAYALGLKLMNEETARGRADLLCRKLESDSKKNVLILLDNLWTKLDLNEVGIPCGYDNKARDCKLLLTSRNREVLRTDMGSDREFRLKELPEGEARQLFKRTVGDRVEDPDIKPWVNRVVKKRGGLPLLIVSLAKRLKRGNLAAWRNASTRIEGPDLNSLVELNYNDLEDERIKKLFLVCALNNGFIVTKLVLVWCMGLGLYQKFSKTIENARDNLIMDLQILQDCSLLQDSNDMERLRMHDVFVDVANSIPSSEWKALVGRKDYGFKEWSKDELKKCTVISSILVGIDELPEKLDCPNLRMLILVEGDRSLRIPESFFESTKKLQVSHLKRLSLTSLPSSIELLENLNSLYLISCDLEDVAVLGKLKGLQFLSFQGSTIARLPKELGGLTKLRFLELTKCAKLKVIEPGVLGSFVNIEELHMDDNFDQWDAEDESTRSNASLVELKNMKNLSTLSIGIPNPIKISKDLPFGKLKGYQIQIGEVWDWPYESKESRTLKLKLDSGDLLLEEWVKKCLQRTEDLHLDGLQDGNDSIHDLCVDGFHESKHLHIQNSPSFHYIVHSTENVQCIAFTRLESLFLKNLNNLERICHSDLALESFSKLKIVKVDNCGKIKHLFSSSMTRILFQLEELEISRCHLMQQIVADIRADEDGDEIDDNPKVESFNLRRLTLRDLPKMTSFYKTTDRSIGFFDGQQVIFPSLEELKLSFMCQLKRIWHNQLHEQSFCKLASLTVEFCENLSHVFPSNSMERLQSLNKMEVVGCPSLEALFEPVRISSTKRQKSLVLYALEKIKLLNLPRLRDILKSDCKVTLAFPSLMEVNVRRCNSLSYLFSSATAKTLDKLATLDVSCCDNLRSIIAVEQGKGKPMETLKFHQLSTLKLGDLDKLISFRLASCAGDGLHPLFDEKLAFPKLEELQVQGVQQEELWNDKILVESFCRLKVLKVKQCHNLMNVIPSSVWDRLLRCMKSLTIENCSRLSYLFTMSMAKSLGQLQYLCLRDCGEMEHIVAREEGKLEEVTDKIVISQIVTLYLHNMPKLRSFYQGMHISKWPSLKEFTVENCTAVEGIIGNASCRSLEDGVPNQQSLLLTEKVEFPNMESMKISHMDNMDSIWPDEIASNAFSKLKTLAVEHCEKLSSIMSSFTMFTRFQNLEKIIVTDCGSLEVVFNAQKLSLSKAQSTSTFQLRELVLMRLPKMKHVWSGLSQGSLNFGHFERMEVRGCESFESLFPSHVAKNMTRLKELLERSCGVEEIIMEEDGAEASAGSIFFPQLADLRLIELPKLRSFHKNSHASTWPLLKQLRVRHCGKMMPFSFACGIQSCQGNMISENLPTLFPFEKVMQNLAGVTLTKEDVVTLRLQQHYTFDYLRQLSLSCFHDENDAFPSDFLLRRFPNLERLVVLCSYFVEIFPENASGSGGAVVPCGGLTDVQKPLNSLGNLKRLDLRKLGNLRQVCKDGSLMAELLKQIKVLFVVECPSLSIILSSPTSFQKLTQLDVKDCDGLVHVGTCSAMTSLVHLSRLTLKNCATMEDVVTDDENGAEEISFPKMKQLILDGLPRLQSFSPTDCAFSFPSLRRVVVKECPKINIFCKGSLRSPNLAKVLLSEDDDEGPWEGHLNATVHFICLKRFTPNLVNQVNLCA